MTIEELITNLARIARSQNMSLYTSTNMRDNPDVCHAACLWFLHSLSSGNAQEVLTRLDSTNKLTLKVAQEELIKGIHVPKAMVETVKKSVKEVSDEDIRALTYVCNYYKQPAPRDYSDNAHATVDGVIRAMRSTADRMLIYMLPASGKGPGHVICIARHVAGVMIYDPNIGVISGRLSDSDAWGSMLIMILQWYAREMKLVLSASKAL